MKIPEEHIDKYFVRNFIKENWGYIVQMIEDSIEDWGEFGEQIIDELRKYDLSSISLEKKDDEENDEE